MAPAFRSVAFIRSSTTKKRDCAQSDLCRQLRHRIAYRPLPWRHAAARLSLPNDASNTSGAGLDSSGVVRGDLAIHHVADLRHIGVSFYIIFVGLRLPARSEGHHV